MVYLTMKVTWATVRFCFITASLFSLVNRKRLYGFGLCAQMHNIFSFGLQMYDILTGKMYRHNTLTWIITCSFATMLSVGGFACHLECFVCVVISVYLNHLD